MDNGKPHSTGNFKSCGSREHLLWGAQDGREMESNSNNVLDCVVQSDYPETLDGSFLTLGVDVNTESRSSLNASSRDIIGKIDGAINLQLNPSHGQSGHGSSFSHDFKMTTGLSDFQTHAGGFSSMEENAVGLSSLKHNFGGLPSIMQNAGESSNFSVFAGTMENVDVWSLSDYDLGVAVSTSSNFSLSPLQMPQSHVPHSFLTPGGQNFGAGFANVDLNLGFHDLSGVSSMVHSSSQSGLPPNQGFHSLSGISPMEHSSSQSGLPVQGQLRMVPRPKQLQRCNMGCIPSLSGTSVSSPVLGNIESNSSQYQSDKLSASEGNAAEVGNIPSFNNIGVQVASQIIPVAGESPPAMTSNLLAGPSLKTKASQTPPATSQVQIKMTSSAKPSILSPTLYEAQNAPFVAPLPAVVSQAATVPSLAQPISSVPPVIVAAPSLPPLARKGPPLSSLSQATPCPPLIQTTPLPSLAWMSPPPHIKWQDTELLQLSGYNCFLCKRDLSYTPEGPVFQPAAPPPVAVLSCGHCFHDLCLQRISSKDEANNPPCIPCVIGES